jgi:hypothetical protein
METDATDPSRVANAEPTFRVQIEFQAVTFAAAVASGKISVKCVAGPLEKAADPLSKD